MQPRHLKTGLPAGAILLAVALLAAPAASRGQEPAAAPRPDSIPAEADRSPAAAADTLKAPLPTAELPTLPTIGPEYRWRGDEIFSSGALTLLDLLQGLPEVSGMRSGWLLPPEYATVSGGLGRIRILLDDVELDAIDPRQDGLQDLGMVQLWPMEEVAVERGVDELRVHLTSWRAEHTSPVTRVDVATGDYNTDLYRGYFGKRFGRGEVVQVGGQQFSMRDPVFGGTGDRLSLVARAGIARTSWSVDGWFQRTGGIRERLTRLDDFAPLEAQEMNQTVAYARAAWRAPREVGLWAQLVASTQQFTEEVESTGDTEEDEDPPDLSWSRAQYVATLGWRQSGLSLSAIGRMRVYEGESFFSPMVRAGYDSPRFQLAAFAEQRAEDDRTRLDASARVTPVPFLALSGGVAVESYDGGENRLAVRAEGGILLGSLWVVGGVVSAENLPAAGLTPLDPAFVEIGAGDAAGVYAGLRGDIWRNFRIDVTGTRWNRTAGMQLYRPEVDIAGRVEYFNQFLERFPRGNFHLRTGLFGGYTSGVDFPAAIGGNLVPLRTAAAPGLNALLEIRISDAVITVQYRNILGMDYETVPGYLMPRQTIIYGARWSFRN